MTTIKLNDDDAFAFDWKVTSLGQVGGGAGVAGGAWFFTFRSKTAKVEVPFVFVGFGLGVGGSLGGASIPNASDAKRGNLSWTNVLHVDEDGFKADDLNWAKGRLTTIGASVGAGYGVMYITAFTTFGGTLFRPRQLVGYVAGVGANAATTFGMWKRCG